MNLQRTGRRSRAILLAHPGPRRTPIPPSGLAFGSFGVDTLTVHRHDRPHLAPAERPQPESGRSARLGVGGLTLALLLTTAIAGLTATADLTDRSGERSTRIAVTRVEIAASILLGHGLVTIPAIQTLQAATPTACASPASPESRAIDAVPPRRAMVRAGLLALPPPACA